MDLKSGVDNTYEAYQDHERRRKEIHNEFEGVIEIKGTDQCFNAENEEKKREDGNDNILPPPETRAHLKSSPLREKIYHIAIFCQAS